MPHMNGRIPHLFLTVGRLGDIPIAPGTFGSLPTVIFALLLVWLVEPRWLIDINIALFGLIFAIACVRFGVWAEARFGKKDAQRIVADEAAGQALPLLFLPWRQPMDGESWSWNITLALVAFICFRAFDVSKPPPIRLTEQLPAGWGVLMDDLIAGFYALIATHLIAWLVLPQIFGP